MEQAYNLLAEMKQVGIQPNAHCYNPLIMGFGSQVMLVLYWLLSVHARFFLFSSFGLVFGLFLVCLLNPAETLRF